MAGSSEASAAQRSKEPSAETPGTEQVVQVLVDGRGWDTCKLFGFEMELRSESKIAEGRFIVNEYNCQPFGFLQAGATAYVAEAVASMMTAYSSNFQSVAGVELNVNHIRSVPVGSEILWTCTPLLLGKRLMVWEVKFETEEPKPQRSDSKTSGLVLVAVSRVSVMIVPTEDKFIVGRHEHIDTFAGMTFLKNRK